MPTYLTAAPVAGVMSVRKVTDMGDFIKDSVCYTLLEREAVTVRDFWNIEFNGHAIILIKFFLKAELLGHGHSLQPLGGQV